MLKRVVEDALKRAAYVTFLAGSGDYPPESQTQFTMAYYVINYSKLRIWEVQYIPTD